MSLYDWNGDGKKDSTDDFIEFSIYNQVSNDNNNHYTPRSRNGGISTIGLILIVFSGLIGQAIIYTMFDIEVDDVPVFVIILLWLVISGVVGFLVSAFKR